MEPFVAYVLACLSQGNELFRGTGYREAESFITGLKSDTARRRRFLRAAARRSLTSIDVYHLMRTGLLCTGSAIVGRRRNQRTTIA
jgi:hypothetical protein